MKQRKIEKVLVQLDEKIKRLEKLTAVLEKQNELRELEIEENNKALKKKTGYPSKDMPWLKYFPSKAQFDKINQQTLYQQIKIANKDNLDENMKQLQKIVFKESGSFFHQKDISQIEKNKELQNLAIYEWSNDGEVCIYDLKNFSINDSYNAKRAYLVMIDLYDETN